MTQVAPLQPEVGKLGAPQWSGQMMLAPGAWEGKHSWNLLLGAREPLKNSKSMALATEGRIWRDFLATPHSSLWSLHLSTLPSFPECSPSEDNASSPYRGPSTGTDLPREPMVSQTQASARPGGCLQCPFSRHIATPSHPTEGLPSSEGVTGAAEQLGRSCGSRGSRRGDLCPGRCKASAG